MDVGVIGCGTAGAAAALFLARAGHRVTVYERVPQPGPVGAGILVQPTGQAALARLGLEAEVRARAAPIDRLLCLRRGGRTVVDLHYGDIGDVHGLGVHRGVLFQSLFGALGAEPNAALRLGCAVERVEPPAGGQRRIALAGGGSGGPHDLVVVADGAESTAQLLPELSPRTRAYPWGALWFVARDPERAFHSRLHQVVDGARRMLGLLPTGLSPSTGEPIVSLFWSIRADRVAAWRGGDLAAWKDEVRALEPAAAPVLDQIARTDDVVFASYADVRLRRWHGDRVVVLGDAAHATSPQLGQGANLALWDAMVLADSLAAPGDAGDAGDALALYSRTRRAHIRYYQLAARWLTPLFQSDSRAGGWLRDRLMPIALRVGPLRRMMIETMAGVRRGIVRRSMPLRELGRPQE